MGANAFGISTTIAIQLLSLPLFMQFWDVKTYGAWLMISAIPSYLSIADVGMVTAAGNEMTIAIGQGSLDKANRIFQSAQLFMMLVCSVLALIIIPLIIWVPLHDFSNDSNRIALGALAGGVLLSLCGGLTEAIYKSCGQLAMGTVLTTFVRIAEWLGSMLGLVLWRSIEAVAICSLFARLLGTIVGIGFSGRVQPGLRWGVIEASTSEIRYMIKPAISFMILPLASALSLQGVTLLVGTMHGVMALALFNTYRTIARLGVQLTSIFSIALSPEFSRLFGQGGMKHVEKLYRRSVLLGALQAVGFCLLLYFASPFLLKIWTHAQIEFEPRLMMMMMIYAAIAGLWNVPRGFLTSVNQPMQLAKWSLFTGLLVIGLSWVFGNLWKLNGVVLAMLLTEIMMAAVCVFLVNKSLRTL